MLGYVQIVTLYNKNYILYQGKGRPAHTKLMPPKLRAVLDTFGFSKNEFADSAHCKPARSPTPRSVSQFWIFEKYSNFFSKYHHMDPKFPGNKDIRKSDKFV